MSITLVNKSTGEEITLPTPTGDKQTKIDELPSEPLTDVQIEAYEKYLNKRGYTLQRSTPPHKKT